MLKEKEQKKLMTTQKRIKRGVQKIFLELFWIGIKTSNYFGFYDSFTQFP